MAPARGPKKLPLTGVDEADELLARDPLALPIGFVVDQQIPLRIETPAACTAAGARGSC